MFSTDLRLKFKKISVAKTFQCFLYQIYICRTFNSLPQVRYKLDESEFDIFLSLHSNCFLFAQKIYSFIHWTSTLDSHLQRLCIKTWLDYRDDTARVISMSKLQLLVVKYVVVTFHSISSCNCCISLKMVLFFSKND